MVLEPVSVALKFGFLAVLYLFLLWVARSALKDLRGRAPAPLAADATGLYSAAHGIAPVESGDGPPRLQVESAAGIQRGVAFDVSEGLVLGRGDDVDLQLEDTFASSRHAQIAPQGTVLVLSDLGSTNGTFLNGEPLRGPQPLHPGDRIRIGESEFTFQH
jgi:hypothetical protein